MEVLIKNYKTTDTSKKRKEKRERELGLLTLFKQYGIKLIKLEKQERENKNNETKEDRPPPYALSCDQTVNQMPVGQGKIDLKGPIEFEGYLHDENTEAEKEQSWEKRGTVGSREKTHTHTAMREGLEQPRARRRASTPLSQPRQKERERENSPQGGAKEERERAENCREEGKTGEPPTYHYLSEMLEDLAGRHRHMTSGCEGVENYQAEEPEETPEGRLTPADSIQEVQDEMKERCNRTREDIKQAVHMTQEEFEKTVNSLHQELDELIDKRKPMQHSSPHDYVLRKQYKQVAGTLVMQDIEPPEDQLQVHLTRRQRGREEHRSTRGNKRSWSPKIWMSNSSSSKDTPNIYLGPAKIWTLWFPRLPDIHEGGREMDQNIRRRNSWKTPGPGWYQSPASKVPGSLQEWMTSSSNLASFKQWIGLRRWTSPLTSIDITSGRHWGLNTPMQTDPGFLKGNQWRKLRTPSPTSRNN